MAVTSMTNKGDDCYFFYYSTCAKGDSCPFRHCEAAMGSEVMCTLWQENRCFRSVCKFRHMEIKKNRKEIPCYWENQPGGCQKAHCAFHHEKSRMIDGMYVPADKGPAVKREKEDDMSQEDSVLPTPIPISNPTNPQLRGVIKSETQESVPSPTHPPVVINAVDDEDDEDDQISEEGDDVSGVSPRKIMSFSKDDSLNFGIKTLEEIRLRKALKASLKRAGHHSSNGTSTEKENIKSLTHPAIITTKAESPACDDPGKKKIADRLGKRIEKDIRHVDGDLRLKGSLARRLGGFVDSSENNADMPPEKAMRPVHERLGTTSELTAPKSPNSDPKPSGEIRIKTLEEIRQEKATKSKMQCKDVRVVTEVSAKTSVTTKKGNTPVSGPQIKTFSEILHEKKLHEEKGVSQESSSNAERGEGLANAGTVGVQGGEVRVKTLEEIRKEKAARIQAQAPETKNDDASSSGPSASKRRILCIAKNTSAATTTTISQKFQDPEKKVDLVAETVASNGKSEASTQAITVKTFEEIMREKKLRKQQENSSTSSQPEHPGQKSPSELSEEKSPSVIRPRITGPVATESTNQGRPSLRQRLCLKPQTSSVVPVESPQKSPEPQTSGNSVAASFKKAKRSPSPDPPVDVAEVTADSGFHSQELQPEKFQDALKTSPGKAAEIKVRPKLNVKPSVMKPTAQLRLGQKRKLAGSHCSAVAAVKPLNAVPAPDVEPCKLNELPAPASSSEVETSTQEMPSVAEDVNSFPSKTASTPKPISVPQSPTVKTPSQTRARRQSAVSSRAAALAGSSSTMDDFDDLLDEFADDRLEDEMELDPGKGEDDLLLELSEMIDS